MRWNWHTSWDQTLSNVLQDFGWSFLGCTGTSAEWPVNEILNRIQTVFRISLTGPSALVLMQPEKDWPNSCGTLERVWLGYMAELSSKCKQEVAAVLLNGHPVYQAEAPETFMTFRET